MIRRPPRSTLSSSSAASDVYKRQVSTQSTGPPSEPHAMVFFYTICDNKYEELGITVYMGRDKFENEDLIQHGWPEDIWFHVDDYSSAHVYLRLPKGPLRKVWKETGTLDHLPEGILHDLCVLTKNNSIDGSKQHEVDIVYTAWENLNKRQDMDVGTIGFVKSKAVIKVTKVKKNKEDAKRIEKTKSEDTAVDFQGERERRDVAEIAERKDRARKQKKHDEQLKRSQQEEKEKRSYDRIFSEESLNNTRNATRMVDEDDFMGEGSDIEADELADEFADFL
eukprot:TRINITY_DN10342_c0_g1_i1.p1 TRINITY_DN10342_c0_g1~~TRINITY_DN10342_c0_g1_i1.p1  ORF type:complete len:280 (+),score=85.14 TRINITY_DN10342_c0_g1_i1:92-931(+)